MVQNVSLVERLNSQISSEYKAEIINHFNSWESHNYVDPSMMDDQTELKWHYRTPLLEFMIRLHYQLRLSSKTFFLGVQIMDQYYSKRIVMKKHYQLLGLTCFWIASKNHDDKNKVLQLKELKVASRNQYDESLFLQMELNVLSTLNWNVTGPTLDDCLDFSFEQETKLKDNQLYQISKFLCELSLFDRSLLFFPNSLKSIACVLLASRILNQNSYINNFKTDLIKLDFKRSVSQMNNNGCKSEATNNSTFATPFVETFDEESLVQLRKISILLLNALVNNFSINTLKAKYRKQKAADKVSALSSKLKDFLIQQKYNPIVTLEHMASDLESLNANKCNIMKIQLHELFSTTPSNFAMIISSFALGFEQPAPLLLLASVSITAGFNKKVNPLSLDLISPSTGVFDSLEASSSFNGLLTPTSPNSSFCSTTSVPSLVGSSRSNSSSSFSSDDSNTSFEVATPPAEKTAKIIGISTTDIEDNYSSAGSFSVSPYSSSSNVAATAAVAGRLSPKALDFNNAKKINMLSKQTVFKADGYFDIAIGATKDPIKERKRFFESEDSLVSVPKRHSPNLRDNYSFYFK